MFGTILYYGSSELTEFDPFESDVMKWRVKQRK